MRRSAGAEDAAATSLSEPSIFNKFTPNCKRESLRSEQVVFEEKWCIGNFFTEEGYFWNEGFEAKVRDVVSKALKKTKKE